MAFCFNVPLSDPYSEEGMYELHAYQLAAKHLNGEYDLLRAAAQSMIQKDGAIMTRVARPLASQWPFRACAKRLA